MNLCACGHADNCHMATDLEPPTEPCCHGLPEDEWGGALLPEELESGVCCYDGRPWQEPCECKDFVPAALGPADFEAAGQQRLL